MRMQLIRLPAAIHPWRFWLFSPDVAGPTFRNGAHTLCVTVWRWMLAIRRI